jgi:hypothetical protein
MAELPETFCSVGRLTNDKCHKFTDKCSVNDVVQLTATDKTLVAMRSGQSEDSLETVCCCHKKHYLHIFPMMKQNTSCCDPLKVHKKLIKKGLVNIDQEIVALIQSKTRERKQPGQKICHHCLQKINNLTDCSDSEPESMAIADTLYSNAECLNSSFSAVGVSPLKSVHSERKVSYGKRKIKQMAEATTSHVASHLGFPPNKLVADTSQTECTCDSKLDVDYLVSNMNEKLSVSSRNQKIQVLTITPKSWSIDKTVQVFQACGVTRYMVKQARQLAQNDGILADRETFKRNKLDQHTLDSVINYYQDDTVSRLLPGKNDFVTIRICGTKEHKQKRLILTNLKEVHANFKTETGLKIGFSKFVELRPKWCVTVSSSGSHNVCVCEKHQNVKFMVDVISEDYHNLIDKSVCDSSSRNCMLQRCEVSRNCISQNLLRARPLRAHG